MSNLARKIQREKERQEQKEQRKKEKARRLGKPPAGPNRKERREFQFKRGEWADFDD